MAKRSLDLETGCQRVRLCAQHNLPCREQVQELDSPLPLRAWQLEMCLLVNATFSARSVVLLSSCVGNSSSSGSPHLNLLTTQPVRNPNPRSATLCSISLIAIPAIPPGSRFIGQVTSIQPPDRPNNTILPTVAPRLMRQGRPASRESCMRRRRRYLTNLSNASRRCSWPLPCSAENYEAAVVLGNGDCVSSGSCVYYIKKVLVHEERQVPFRSFRHHCG